MITRILIGLLLVIIGFIIVWKTRRFIETFGSIPWADAKLGGGGTSLMYKFIGIVMIFLGFLWATNLWNSFLEATLGSIIPKPEPIERRVDEE
ncbi:hypothetical protein IT408_04605 [Candidatus Uhrbacteria bacterium]|nr:hypothetical protein [Candidatus Uhrbacteria bacterium]